jgi:hypothetical protein
MGQKSVEQAKGPRPPSSPEPAAEAAETAVTNTHSKSKDLMSPEALLAFVIWALFCSIASGGRRRRRRSTLHRQE